MRYFLDCEYIEDCVVIELISIGIVAEDDRALYIENIDCDLRYRMKEDVVKCLWGKNFDLYQRLHSVTGGLLHHNDIAKEISEFCDSSVYGDPEFWGTSPSYMWVAFCQIFGLTSDLPKEFPTRCNDVIQYAEHLGCKEMDLPPSLKTDGNHHALLGARTVKERYLWLRKQQDL